MSRERHDSMVLALALNNESTRIKTTETRAIGPIFDIYKYASTLCIVIFFLFKYEKVND